MRTANMRMLILTNMPMATPMNTIINMIIRTGTGACTTTARAPRMRTPRA